MDQATVSAAPLPLVIGVTGHRDLREEDRELLRERVRHFFEQMRTRFPQLPICVLNALADGGDLLVGEVALAMGLRMIAVLPMPLEVYRQDFPDGATRARFDAQLAACETLQLPIRNVTDVREIETPGRARDLQYAQAGIFISSHCHVLLALWDGVESQSLGGTAQVVNFHLHGNMPGAVERRRAAIGMLGLDEENLVYHIPSARQGQLPVGEQAPVWITSDQALVRHVRLPETFALMFARQTEYAQDVADHATRLRPAAEDAGNDCPIFARFVAADGLAAMHQTRVTRSLQATCALAAAMGLAFIVYADFYAQDVMVYLFLALFALGFTLHLLGRRREWHRKYIDYRALAEGLRVQSFWRRAGIVDSSTPSFAHDNFLQKQDVELGWIRNVMRAASLEGMLRPVVADQARVYAVIQEWIGHPDHSGQLRYYHRSAARRTGQHLRAEWLGALCLWSGIGISVVLAVSAHRLGGQVQNLMVALMGALSIGAAVQSAYSYKKADKELIKQYRFMSRIFRAAQHRLNASRSLAEQQQILRTLGEAALAEHAEWTLMHRERPLDHARL